MAVSLVLVALALQVTCSSGRAAPAAVDGSALSAPDLAERMAVAESNEHDRTSFNKVKRILKLLPYKPHKWPGTGRAAPDTRLSNNSTDIPIAIIVSSANLKTYVEKQTDKTRNEQHSTEDTDSYRNKNTNIESYVDKKLSKSNKQHSKEIVDSYRKKNRKTNLKSHVDIHSDENRNDQRSTEDEDGYQNKNAHIEPHVDKKSDRNLNEHVSTEGADSYRKKNTNSRLKSYVDQHSDKRRNEQHTPKDMDRNRNKNTNIRTYVDKKSRESENEQHSTENKYSYQNRNTNINSVDKRSGKIVNRQHSTEDTDSYTNKNRISNLKSYVEQHSNKSLDEQRSTDTVYKNNSEPDAKTDTHDKKVLGENDKKVNFDEKLGDDDAEDIANINILDVFINSDSNVKKDSKVSNKDDNIIKKPIETNINIKPTYEDTRSYVERSSNRSKTEVDSNKLTRNQETRTKKEDYSDDKEENVEVKYKSDPNETLLQTNYNDVKIKSEDLTKNSYKFINEDTVNLTAQETLNDGREFEDSISGESIRDDTNKDGNEMKEEAQSAATDSKPDMTVEGRDDIKMASYEDRNDDPAGDSRRRRCRWAAPAHKHYNFSFVFNK